jgi:hypothetical protein
LTQIAKKKFGFIKIGETRDFGTAALRQEKELVELLRDIHAWFQNAPCGPQTKGTSTIIQLYAAACLRYVQASQPTARPSGSFAVRAAVRSSLVIGGFVAPLDACSMG